MIIRPYTAHPSNGTAFEEFVTLPPQAAVLAIQGEGTSLQGLSIVDAQEATVVSPVLKLPSARGSTGSP